MGVSFHVPPHVLEEELAGTSDDGFDGAEREMLHLGDLLERVTLQKDQPGRTAAIGGEVGDAADEHLFRLVREQLVSRLDRLLRRRLRGVHFLSNLFACLDALVVDQRVDHHPEEELVDALVLELLRRPLLAVEIQIQLQKGLLNEIVRVAGVGRLREHVLLHPLRVGGEDQDHHRLISTLEALQGIGLGNGVHQVISPVRKALKLRFGIYW
jgi:hypothetical protein